MRPYLILSILVLLFVGLAVHFAFRPLEGVASLPLGDASSGPPQGDASPEDGSAVVESDDAGVEQAVEADVEQEAGSAEGGPEEAPPAESSPMLLDRPLRVIAMGWEILAPGAVANEGLTPGEGSRFLVDGVEVHLAIVDGSVDLQRALAAGGAVDGGADVAIVALPRLAAIYPDLSALDVEIFLVTGCSAGQHELYFPQSPEEGLTSISAGEVELAAVAGSPAHFFSLFALELAGVSPGQVHLAEAEEEASEATLGARRRPARASIGVAGRSLMTTAYVPWLIPYVAVAPRELLDSQEAAIEQISLTWLEAASGIAADVPRAARQIGALEGAPSALELLGPLSRVAPASLDDNARLAGLTGRSAADLGSLYQLTARLWREAGVTDTAAPPVVPVATELLASIARAGLVRRAGRYRGGDDDRPLASEALAPLWLVRDLGEGEASPLERLGLVAEVFSPLPLRARGGSAEVARLEELLELASDRYGLTEGRVQPSETSLTGEGVIEILAPR